MVRPRQPDDQELAAQRESWRLRELGCSGGLHVEAAILHLVSQATNRPLETMPRPSAD